MAFKRLFCSVGKKDVCWFSLSIGDKDLLPAVSLFTIMSISNPADNKTGGSRVLGLGNNVSRNSLFSYLSGALPQKGRKFCGAPYSMRHRNISVVHR